MIISLFHLCDQIWNNEIKKIKNYSWYFHYFIIPLFHFWCIFCNFCRILISLAGALHLPSRLFNIHDPIWILMSSPIYAYCEVAQNIYILCLEVCDRGLRHLSHAYQQTKIKGLMPLAHWPLHLSVSHRDRLIAITLHTLRMYKLKA